MSPSPGQNQDNQKTIARQFSLEGIGIHSGRFSKISVKPAEPDTGITFLKNGRKIRALVENVVQTERGTVLGGIAVVEHFLAAAFALGIDNLTVEVDGDELPALDGSALPFVEALEEAGIAPQPRPKAPLVINKPFSVTEGEASLEASPFNGFKVDFMIKFKGIGEQFYSFILENNAFKEAIAPARTFGYASELAALRARGLGQGASAKNALVLNERGFETAPRFADEPVRHKILDLIGDLALLGRPIKGYFKASRSGHALNARLARALLSG